MLIFIVLAYGRSLGRQQSAVARSQEPRLPVAAVPGMLTVSHR